MSIPRHRPTVGGRPAHPVALGLTLTMFILASYNTFGKGALDGTQPWASVVAVTAAATCAVLTVGWWRQSQRLTEYGLLAVFGIEIARSIAITLVAGVDTIGVWLGLATATIAGGSYLLERWNP